MNKGLKKASTLSLCAIGILLAIVFASPHVGGIFSFFKLQNIHAGTPVSWTGGGDGASWNDPDNWSSGAVPAANDDITIDSNVTVYLPSQINSSLKAHWKLNDDAANKTVTDSHGSVTGTSTANTSTMTTVGKLNSAFDFDGTKYVSFGDVIQSMEPNDQVTLAAWVQFDNLAAHDPIFVDGGHIKGWEFGLYGGELHIGVENNDSHRSLGYSTAGLSTGTWYHVAAVLDGANGDMFLYVDGSLVASDTTLAAFTDFNGVGTTKLGHVDTSPSANASSLNNFFDGRMDDVRVYNSVLSAGDIGDLYNSGTGTEDTYVAPSNATIDSLTLGNSGGTTSPTLVFAYDAITDGALTIDATDLTVYSGATINHAVRSGNFTPAVNIDVQLGDATIAGSVNVNSRGYASQSGPGAPPSSIRNGASHGGEGATTTSISLAASSVYGSVTAPVTHGSGAGGAGGGVAKLNVNGTLTLSGSITANGSDGSSDQGGAAGGSVNVTAGTLSGAGTISANGGNAGTFLAGGSGGGGGRIAVNYTTDSSTITETAYGGAGDDGASNTATGGAGTIYLKPSGSSATLILNNNGRKPANAYWNLIAGKTPLTPSGTALSLALDTLTLQNGGHLVLTSDTTLTYSTLNWSTDGIITDRGGSLALVNTGADTSVPSGALLYADTARTWNSLTVDGTVKHTANYSAETYKIDLTISTDATVNASGSINVDGSGYATGFGTGSPADAQAGASHGGLGGNRSGTRADVYGSITAPVSIGSGGGQTSTQFHHGGGAIRLNVTGTTTVTGSLTADGVGGAGNSEKSGGTGGSIYLTTGTLAGTGTVSAEGGTGGTYITGGGPGGGGGRIAVEYGSDTSTITFDVSGGTSPSNAFNGGSGTIYLLNTTSSADHLILDNDGVHTTYTLKNGRTPLTPSGTPLSLTVDTLTIRDYAYLDLTSDTTLSYTTLNWDTNAYVVDEGGSMPLVNTAADVTIPETSYIYAHTARTWNSLTVDGTLAHFHNTTTKDKWINLTITTDLTVNATGSINASGRGFAAGSGTGKSAATEGAPSYGGVGGNFRSSAPGAIYGSITAPTDFGSGAFTSSTDTEGSAGGAIRLDVGGTTTLNGPITANGNTGYRLQAGGTGGSVYLTTNTLAGSSSISAIGGNGGEYIGQGGSGAGGGRIAVEYASDISTVTYNARGGMAKIALTQGGTGGGGTVYLSDTAGGTSQLIIDNGDLVTDMKNTTGYGLTPLTPSGTPLTLTITTLIIRNDGNLDLNSDTTLNHTNITWNDDGYITDNGGSMTLLGGAADVVIPSGATLFADSARSVGTLEVSGTLMHSRNTTAETYKIDFTTTGNMTVNAGATINVDAQGYNAATGTGAGEESGDWGSGAGHGGAGGVSSDAGSTGGSTYGSDTAPTTIGSGGGNDGSGGGRGAGAIKLTVGGDLTLGADIAANGSNGTGDGGGGSGGSIWLVITGNFDGSGQLYANGGNTASASAGTGGGGRIRYECGGGMWSGAASVAAGTGGNAGAAGTISQDCTVGNTAPFTSALTASQASDGSGNVEIQFNVDDAEDDDTVRVLVEYNIGGGWQKATISTTNADTTATYGDPAVDNAATYQIGTASAWITTSSGANTINTIWNARTDEAAADTAAAQVRVTPYDGIEVGSATTSSNFDLDVVAPTFSSASYKDTDSDGTVDRVDVVFSEAITLSSYQTDDWSFPETGAMSLDDSSIAIATNTARITVSATADITGSTTSPTVLYTNNGNRLKDSSGNFVATFGAAQTITDAASPALLSVTPAHGSTAERDDDVVVTFSEAMDTSGSFAYTFSDEPSGISTAWSASDTIITISHTGTFTSGEHTFTVTTATGADGRSFIVPSDVTHPVTFSVAAPTSSSPAEYVSYNSITLGGGKECVTASTVDVLLKAKNATKYLISEDPFFVGAEWQEFNATKNWTDGVPFIEIVHTFPQKSGEYTLYALYRSSTGSLSSRVLDTITIDLEKGCVTKEPEEEQEEEGEPVPDQDPVEEEEDSSEEDPSESEEEGSAEEIPVGKKAVSPLTGEEEEVSEVLPNRFIRVQGYDQIYYIDEDLKRRPLSSLESFFTYGENYSALSFLTGSTLPFLKLGNPMLPKPGTVLMKFNTGDKVYFLTQTYDGKPLLRHVLRAETAVELFGEDWPEYILHVDSAFFTQFNIGRAMQSGEEVDASTLMRVRDIRALIEQLSL